MRVRATTSFEYNLKPVLTVREEFVSEDLEAANKTAVFRAFKQHPRPNCRSMVTVVENLDFPVSSKVAKATKEAV